MLRKNEKIIFLVSQYPLMALLKGQFGERYPPYIHLPVVEATKKGDRTEILSPWNYLRYLT